MKAMFWAAPASLIVLAGCQLPTRAPSPPHAHVPQPPPVTVEDAIPAGAYAVPPGGASSSTDAAGLQKPDGDILLAAHQEPPRVESDAGEALPLAEKARSAETAPLPENVPVADNDAEPTISLSELEATALANSPAVAEATANIQALQGRYVQAGLPFNPTAGYTATEIGNEGEGGQQGVYLGQEFIRGNKLGLSQAVVAQEIRRAQEQLEAARLRTLTDVRLGHFELLVAQRRQAITSQLAENSERARQSVEALVTAEEASGVDLLQAEIEVQTAETLVQNAQTNVEGAWRRLAAVMGDPTLPRMQVAGELEDQLPLAQYETIVAQTVSASPQLAAAYAQVDRDRWAVERARAEGIPNVTAQGQLQYDFSTDDTIAGVQVGLPLPIYNWNQGGVQEAMGDFRASQQAARRVELSLERQLAQAYQDYFAARQRVERYAAEILPRAERTLNLTRTGYSNGEFSFLQLLTVQRTYFQTNLAYLDSLSEMGSAGRRMNGLLLSDSLESSPRQD